MPKTHNIGSRFFQITKFPYDWGSKYVVRGWTQEIEEPFRTATPLIVRLPRHRALVLGLWTGKKESEEEALNAAINSRWDLDYDDFTEETGWTPPPNQDTEESLDALHSRLNSMDGTLDVHDWQTNYRLAKESE